MLHASPVNSPPKTPGNRARWVRTAAAIAIVVAMVLLPHYSGHVNQTTEGFLLLLVILGISTVWGLLEAGVASVAATLGFNYFFMPPVGTLTIADPQNWIALGAFLITAVTASQLSAVARRRTQEAVGRRRELEHLFDLAQ